MDFSNEYRYSSISILILYKLQQYYKIVNKVLTNRPKWGIINLKLKRTKAFEKWLHFRTLFLLLILII